MAYIRITPVNKSGFQAITGSAGSAVLSTTSNGFRNIAIGARLQLTNGSYPSGITKTVLSRTSDNSITMDSTYASDPDSTNWNYTNPYITDSSSGSDATYEAVRSGLGAFINFDNGKQSNAFKMAIPYMDSDQTIVMDMDGVERQLSVTINFAPGTSTIRWTADGTNYTAVSTLDTNIDNMIIIAESLTDGQQFAAASIPTFSTRRPDRTYSVFFMDVKTKYIAGEPSHLVVDVMMIERGM